MRVAQYTQIDCIGKCMLILLCVVYVMYIHLQFYVKWSDLCSYELNEVLRLKKNSGLYVINQCLTHLLSNNDSITKFYGHEKSIHTRSKSFHQLRKPATSSKEGFFRSQRISINCGYRGNSGGPNLLLSLIICPLY